MGDKVPDEGPGRHAAVGLGLLVAGLLLLPAASAAASGEPGGVPVCVAPGNQLDPILIGNGTAVWNDYREGPAGIFYVGVGDAQRPGFAASTGIRIYAGAGDASAPRAIPFPASILATWSDTRNGAGNADVFVQRMSGTEVWPSFVSDGIPVCTAPGDQVDPSIADDGAGGFFIAWCDGRDEATSGKDIYLQHYHENGQVWDGWPEGGLRVCGAAGDQVEPVAISDGTGGAAIYWSDLRSGNSDIYAVGVDAGGILRPGWSKDGNPICAAPGEQGQLRVVPDGQGGAYLSWLDSRAGTPQTYAIRVSSAGAPWPGWLANGVAVSSGSADSVEAAALCNADSGGVFLAWTHVGAGSSGVSVQRLLGDGSSPPGWPPGGRVVGTAAASGVGLAAMPDRAGGVFVAWNEMGSGIDIRALRLHGDGTTARYWPPGGAVLSGAPGDQILPGWRSGQPPGGAISWDGGGGALVAWTDHRDPDDLNIYAQEVTGDGVVAPTRAPGCWFECGPDYVPDYIQRVYPNPTRGAFTVDAWVPEQPGVWVDVFDIRGRLRYRQEYDQPGPVVREIPVHLPPLPGGVYFLQYRVGGRETGYVAGRRKLIVIH